MDIINASEEIKNQYRSSFKYAFIYDEIEKLFDRRVTINKTYSSNSLLNLIKEYYYKLDKEINMMNNYEDNLYYITNELIVLVFCDLGYNYKQHTTNKNYYYFNVSAKKIKKIIKNL